MLGWLTKRLVSVIITLMTIGVPREKYQQELDSLPTVEQRLSGGSYGEWSFRAEQSAATGMTHCYFACPAERGERPVIACFPGFNTDGRVFFALSPLADTYQVLAYSFPERSALYTGSMDDFVAILDDFFAVAGVDTVAVLGNSVGGAIALHYAASPHRAQVTRLVLLSTNVFGASPDDTREIRGMADRLLPYPDFKLYYLITRGKAIVSRFGKTELAEGTPTESLAIKHIDWYRQVLRSLYDYNGVPYAGRVAVPTLAMHGAEDRLIPVERAQVIGDLVPGAVFERVPGAGHGLVFEKGDLVAGRIRLTASTSN